MTERDLEYEGLIEVYNAAMAVANNGSLDFGMRVIREEYGLVTLAKLLDRMVDACRREKEGR